MIKTLIITNIISLVFGVFIGEPLKNIVNGNLFKTIKFRRKKKLKDKILKIFKKSNNGVVNIDAIKIIINKTTINIDKIYNCLIELEDEGFIHRIKFDGETRATSLWRYIA